MPASNKTIGSAYCSWSRSRAPRADGARFSRRPFAAPMAGIFCQRFFTAYRAPLLGLAVRKPPRNRVLTKCGI